VTTRGGCQPAPRGRRRPARRGGAPVTVRLRDPRDARARTQNSGPTVGGLGLHRPNASSGLLDTHSPRVGFTVVGVPRTMHSRPDRTRGDAPGCSSPLTTLAPSRRRTPLEKARVMPGRGVELHVVGRARIEADTASGFIVTAVEGLAGRALAASDLGEDPGRAGAAPGEGAAGLPVGALRVPVRARRSPRGRSARGRDRSSGSANWAPPAGHSGESPESWRPKGSGPGTGGRSRRPPSACLSQPSGYGQPRGGRQPLKARRRESRTATPASASTVGEAVLHDVEAIRPR
jgi:hypothetical protein